MLIEGNFPKDKQVYDMIGRAFGVRVLGDGLITNTDHEKWRHKRAIFNRGFQRRLVVAIITF